MPAFIIGINYSAMLKSVSMPFPYVIYPSTAPDLSLFTVVLVAVVSAFAAALPSWSIHKLTPAQVLRNQ